jgi:hypothetical protein
VFDHVERGRFSIDPTRKNTPPLIVAAAHIGLEKCTGQLFMFPWRGFFAGAQPDDEITQADRLSGFHGKFARIAATLVKHANHRHAFRHRRHRPL